MSTTSSARWKLIRAGPGGNGKTMTTITDPEALPSADSAAAPGELRTVPHWSAGAPYPGTSTRTSDVYDPATGRVTKKLVLASPQDADAVITAAHDAWPA